MKMRSEFNQIRKYNASKMECIVEGNYCNKKIESKLRELEYYKTAKPIKGLNDYYQIMIRQIIIQKLTELYKELERLKDHARCIATRQSLAEFLVELYTVHY